MKRRILLIKLTSLGDVIHALPALTDAHRFCPDIVFDWMIDEHFQEVAKWHPAVDRIYTTNHRTWRKNLVQGISSLKNILSHLGQTSYDLVIDGQGNFKTALLSLFANGPRAGFDRHSVREWIAHLAYQRRFAASKKSHAIERLRRLFSSALGYPMPLTSPDCAIDRSQFIKPEFDLPSEYVVFIHNAGWQTKLWPEEHWIHLIKKASGDGLNILLPWGNLEEKERAERLKIDARVHVLPKLSLSEMGYILERAKACVAMDTGLSHLIGALNIPSVALYGATHAGLIGVSGDSCTYLTSSRFCSPCEKKTCRYNKKENPCLKEITPERVYKELLRKASLRYL